MPELLGRNEDILMDLELLKRYSQEKEVLSDNQKDSLKRLPKAKRQAREEEILKKQERERKERLRIRTLELEDKVRQSGLPSDITNEILDMLAYAKERNMTFIYSVEQKIEALEIKIKEAEVQKAKENEQQTKIIQDVAMAGTAVVAGLALAPYVQVRFNKEEFEKRTESFYESKILPELLASSVKSAKPLGTDRSYPKKAGSMYSKSHYELEEKHKNELMDILVRNVQGSGKGSKTPTEIIKTFESMPEVKKRAALRAIRLQNPELAARQDAEKKLEEKATIDKGIVRLRRKKAAKAAKIEKALARQSRQAEQSLKKDRIQQKGPRVAERVSNEKPVAVKGVSPALKQAEVAPTAVKEDKKGISGRLMKVEQITDIKKEPKGISAALMVAEQRKLQEAQNRVVAANKEKIAPNENKEKTPQIIGDGETKSRDFWLRAHKQHHYRKTA